MKKKKPWAKPRHKFFYWLSKVLIGTYAKIVYRYRAEKFDNRDRPYLFLFNHQTPLDQNLMYESLPRQPYTVATEDLFSMGLISRIIEYTQAPIPFKKSSSDFNSVKKCVQIAREGNSIAIAPEGNRTFTGETGAIKKSIVKLIKILKLPVAIYLIRGGFGKIPRYADTERGGRMTGGVSRVIEYEEYQSLSDDELYELLCRELYVNESQSQEKYRSRKKAQFVERAVYICPKCGELNTLYSKGRRVICKKEGCGFQTQMSDRGEFLQSPVRNLLEWTKYQNEAVRNLPVGGGSLLCTETVKLIQVRNKKKKAIAKKVQARLYTDRLEIGDRTFSYTDVTAMTVLGRKKLGFYVGEDAWQVMAGKRFCALKYVNVYYHYQNMKKGEDNDGFLGI